MNNEYNQELWEIAKRRASFKRSVITYLVIQSLFVTTWYFTTGVHSYFWPVWAMLGWGIGLIFQYFSAYHSFNFFSTEKEYKKLAGK